MSSHLANPIDSVKDKHRPLQLVEVHRQVSSSLQTVHKSPQLRWVPIRRSCKSYSYALTPRKMKKKSGLCKDVGHGLFRLWWPDPGRKYGKSRKQSSKESAQVLLFDVQVLIRRTGAMQRTYCQLQTAVCLSVLICNYLFSGSSCISTHLNHIPCHK